MKRNLTLIAIAAALLSTSCLKASSSRDVLNAKADKGDYRAQEQLGEIYIKGEGVTTDKKEARKWFILAAAHFKDSAARGEPEALFQYGKILQRIAAADYKPEGFQMAQENQEAAFCFIKAAYKGHALAQLFLSGCYYFGQGVKQNDVEGLAWEIISANSQADEYMRSDAIDELRRSEIHFGPEKMARAKQRSKEILADIETTNPQNPPAQLSSNSTSLPKSSGSGAIVSAQGIVLTAAHVMTGAKKVLVVTVNGKQEATVLKIDETNDVAVLKIGGGPYAALPIALSRNVRLGQTVATIGFPNIVIQGFSPKVTRGEISSMSGAGDDPRSWQVSVPVQPGNSGGPLLDENGNLIGIVVSKLGIRASEVTGDIPQNVNYALKSAYALALLEPYIDSNAAEPKQPSQKQTFADMVSTAQQSAVLIIVY